MNLNYVGSVAQRFMKFRSGVSTSEDTSVSVFNAISMYIPKSLAVANIAEGSYVPDDVTPDKYAVLTVTVDNYKDVLNLNGALIAQWLKIFRDGTNSAVILYLIVFDDTDFAVTIGQASVTWAPLTKAFNELYFISYRKVMFSEHYNGRVVATGEDTDYDDKNYFDMVLALSFLCEIESTLSYLKAEVLLTIPEAGAVDDNPCQILALDRGDETTTCTTFMGTSQEDRAKYLWGYLLLIGGNRTALDINNGTYMVPIVWASWFGATNDSGTFVGNKIAKIRLSGSAVKPTGLPSPLNSDVNLNLSTLFSDRLDSKNVGYFMSISDKTANNAELIRDRTLQNVPITANMISKWIDYHTSQDLANYSAEVATLTKPVLMNEATYSVIQSMLVENIQKFCGTARIVGVEMNFPAMADAKQGQKFVGTAVWTAQYVDDFEAVDISGSITF